jgi:DNA ligase-1
MENNFDTLYSKKSSNKILEWNITVSGTKNNATITTIYGDLNGKKIKTNQLITIGKNIGKKNETTPFEQAVKEATSKWSNKMRSNGYIKELHILQDDNEKIIKSDKISTKNNNNDKKSIKNEKSTKIQDVSNTDFSKIRPMLAHPYNKAKRHIKYPCLVQPKLDGIRCIAFNLNGEIILMSRTGKHFPHLNHIRDALSEIKFNGFFDGELFTRNLEFQEISGIVRKEKIKESDVNKSLLIEYHIYDVYNFDEIDMPFNERFNLIDNMNFKSKSLVKVKTFICSLEEDMLEKYDDFIKDNYEGIMIRNYNGLYKLKYRSNDLIKLKPFQDSEYKIVNFKDGVGKESGCVIWICDNGNGDLFSVRPQGTVEERQELFKNAEKYIGKMLSVRYQELINNIPRFGIGIDIRDYE